MWATCCSKTCATGAAREHALRWRRGDRAARGALRARARARRDRARPGLRPLRGRHSQLGADARSTRRSQNPHPITYAAREAVRATADVVELTLVSIVRLMQGRLSIKSIGGPLTIFDVAGTAARQGALNYLTLMAFISINLGLINLLPIPLLDGGHLLFFCIEAVVRRPLSVQACASTRTSPAC